MKHRIGANFAFLLLAGSCVPGMLFSQAVEAPKQNPAQALNLQTQGQPAGQVQDLQSPGQQNGKEPPDPQLKPNPLEVLRNFEPAADEEYRLGKGDEIAVDFVGRPDLATRLVIGPDGRITLPLAGDLVLSGQTRGEAARAIEAALSSYYTRPTGFCCWAPFRIRA
jgi:hypothetical protein